MLALRKSEWGVSLIELIIGLAIVAVLLAAGAPSFSTWIRNTQIRNAVESIQNGLQLARSEAVRRNAAVQFSFTTTVDNSCALSTAGANWVVSLSDPSAKCATTPKSGLGDPAPQIIQIRSNAEGSSKAVASAGQSAIVFNGLGQVTPAASINICVGITGVDSTACYVAGDERHLQVAVSTGGQIRMCDPKFAAGSDPQGC